MLKKMQNLKYSKDINRKQEILNAATKLFFEQGYDNATTRELAGMAGVSKASIYYHFKDKEEILLNVLKNAVEQLHDAFKLCVSDEEEPQKNLFNIVFNLLNIIQTDKMQIGLLIKEIERLKPEQRGLIQKKVHAAYKLVEDEIKKLESQGKLKSLNINALSFSLLAMCNWTYHWFEPDKPLTTEDLAHEIMEVFIDGSTK